MERTIHTPTIKRAFLKELQLNSCRVPFEIVTRNTFVEIDINIKVNELALQKLEN